MGLPFKRCSILLDARHRKNLLMKVAISTNSSVRADVASYRHQFVFEVHLSWASPEVT